MDETTPAGKPIVDREKTAPFLIRTFVKVGTYHRLNQFEDGPLPLTDEQPIYTWKDATLREVLTTLRASAPAITEYRHPLARYSFRAVFADAGARGRFSQKDLGTVYSRDILGEPGSLGHPAPRLLADAEPDSAQGAEQDRTLDELRFVPGDYLCVMVQLPKGVAVPGAAAGVAAGGGPGAELAIKGSAAPPPPGANGWKGAGARAADGGWGGSVAPAPGPGGGAGRGGGHWRGGSGPEPPVPRGGRGGRGGGGADFGRERDRERERERERDRDRDRDDRRVPPPRRDSPPPPPRREGWGGGGRRPMSRSRSPPRRRRYD